jgi:drug/metabolite transporter (DMT)-like permease
MRDAISASADTAALAAPPGPPTRTVAANPAKAVGLIVIAWACFAGIDISAKYLTTRAGLPAVQVIWVRFIGQLVAILMVLGLAAVPQLLRSVKPAQQLLRSALLLISTATNFFALKYLRIDQTTTIMFMTPLLVALIAGPLLGEWVGWRRMVAIMVGFCGILIAVRPGFAEFHPAFLLSLAGMTGYAFFSILTRYLSDHDSTATTLFYSLLVGATLLAPMAITAWLPPPDMTALIVLLTIGLWGGVGHYLFIVAHRYAPASMLSPVGYVALLTHSTAGFLVFGDVPDRWTLAGALVVIASGLYLFHRERVRKSAPT